MRGTAAVLVVFTAFGGGPAAASCVNPGGTGGCFASIQTAIDVAVDGEIIDVAAGTYTQGAVLAPRTRVHVRGEGTATTILDPGTGVGFHVDDVDSKLIVSHLTIRGIVRVLSGARAELSDCVVTQSAEDGIICLGGTRPIGSVVVRDSTIEGNADSGIVSLGCRALEVSRSVVADNGQDGIFATTMVLEDSTVSGNGGRGVAARFRARITRSTIADNVGVGLVMDSPSPSVSAVARLRAVILADNAAGSGGDDCDSPRIISRGYNLLEACTEATGLKSSDIVGLDPALGPLQDNGGPTHTHALLAGSPAIAAIDRAALCGKPDQRGVPRAVPCDIGAYEAP